MLISADDLVQQNHFMLYKFAPNHLQNSLFFALHNLVPCDFLTFNDLKHSDFKEGKIDFGTTERI